MYTIHDHMLYIDGVSSKELVEKFGTPLYIYSENKILDQLNEIKKVFLSKYDNTHAAYACKAFCSLYMCKLLEKEGFWLDIVSGGELFTAISAKFPPERIEFNGNNKTIEELQMALDFKIGRFVVDSVDELYLLEKMCAEKNIRTKILFRITPNVDAHTHDYISTGKKDSKFGIPLDDEVLMPAINYAIKSSSLEFLGFHFHVGSQLFAPSTHLQALEVLLNLVLKVKDQYHFTIQDLNLGGGFGISYLETDSPEALEKFIDPMMTRIDHFFHEHQMKRPHISIEPGRYIVGEAGTQLYTVGTIKEIPGIKKYVSVDGGMTDNIRPGLYQAKYNALLANKADFPKIDCVDISGKCCESTDILIKNINIATPERGDILSVFSTGAYGYAMANNYNKLPIPAVIVIRNETPHLIIRRQSFEDMIEREIIL